MTDSPTTFAPALTRYIGTSRRSHRPFDGGDNSPGTYSAYTWDHESQDWEPYERGVSRMALRGVIRRLEDDGWSSLSYLIAKD